MGDVLRLNDDADATPGGDVLDAVLEWVEHARAGAVCRPLTAVLVLETGDGQLWWAADSSLARCDLARKLGLVDLAMARMRSGHGRLMEQDAPGR